MTTTVAVPRVVTHRAIQMVDATVGVIRGYIFIWTDVSHKDAYGTYFDRARPPQLDIENGMHRRPIFYEHAQDEAVRNERIGVIERVWFDETGLAFEGLLDRSSRFFARIVADIRKGILKTSSGTMPHLADFYEDGAFKSWTLGELSLTENPAEELMPEVLIVRHAEAKRDASRTNTVLSFSLKGRSSMGTLADMLKPEVLQAGISPADLIGALVAEYGLEEVQTVIQQLQPPAADAAGDSAAGTMSALSAFMAGVKQELENRRSITHNTEVVQMLTEWKQEKATRQEQQKTLAQQMSAPPLTQTRTAPAGAIEVAEPRKFVARALHELLFGYMVMQASLPEALRGKIQPVSDEYIRVMSGRAVTAIEKNDHIMTDPSVRSLIPSTRANEVATSTASGGGDEWVPPAWSSTIWERVRNNRIFEEIQKRGMRIEEVPQGEESITVLLEGADPTVYTLSQKTDLAASGRPDVNVGITRIGTANTTLTPGELGMAVAYSDVFEEDSLIRVMAQYSYQMDQKAEETVEQLFINGDVATGASVNINLIDGTPATGLATPYYIASDGALKYALVTGSSTSRDGTVVLDETDFRLTLKLMPSGIRTRKGQCLFIIDSDTHSAALDIPAVKTEDVKRTNATIVSGLLTNVFGVDVLESGFMLLANSAGKIPNAGGTLGRILCVYAPYWAMGWKRRITIETDRDILSGDNIIVAKMRVGFKPRGAGAATTTYNLGV